MIIFPAIDLRGGKCVRLVQGELIGAQPFSLEAGVELTKQMSKLVPTFADKAVEILRARGLEVH